MNNQKNNLNACAPQQYPFAPPPKQIPRIDYGLRKADISYNKNIRNVVIYVWLKGNREFWMFPTGLRGRFLYGYGWNGVQWTNVCFDVFDVKTYY